MNKAYQHKYFYFLHNELSVSYLPVNIPLFKVNSRKTRKNEKYVQS